MNSKIMLKLSTLRLLLLLLIVSIASCQKYKEVDKVKLLVNDKKYDEAIKEANKESNKEVKFNYLGIIYSRKGDLKKSEEYYNKVLKISPKNFKALYNLGLLKARTKKFKDSLTIFNNLGKEHPKNIDVKLKKAYVHYALESNSNSISILKNLVETEKKALTLSQWKEIGVTYEKLKRFNAAAEAYEYYISKAKKDNVKVDLNAIKKKINLLRSRRNEEL